MIKIEHLSTHGSGPPGRILESQNITNNYTQLFYNSVKYLSHLLIIYLSVTFESRGRAGHHKDNGGHWGSNLGPPDLQIRPLPLSYVPTQLLHQMEVSQYTLEPSLELSRFKPGQCHSFHLHMTAPPHSQAVQRNIQTLEAMIMTVCDLC